MQRTHTLVDNVIFSQSFLFVIRVNTDEVGGRSQRLRNINGPRDAACERKLPWT